MSNCNTYTGAAPLDTALGACNIPVNVTLSSNLTIPSGITWTINSGALLTINNGVTLTLNDDLIVKSGGGVLIISGATLKINN